MKKIKVGIMPAAGIGCRLNSLPLTRILPKCLLPLLNKPIMEYGIDNIKRMGVEELYLIVGFKKELFKEYFGDGGDFGVHIEYISQPIPNGLAAAVKLAQGYVKEPFVVTLGDDLTVAKSLDNIVEDFWTKSATIVEAVVLEKDVEKIKQACCVKLSEKGEILDIVEKPTSPTSGIRGCGIYVCDPIVFDFIDKTTLSTPRREKEFTNTVRLIAQEHQAYGSFIDGININVNKVSDLVDAIQLILMNTPA